MENPLLEQVAGPEAGAGLLGPGDGEDQGRGSDKQSVHTLNLLCMNFHAQRLYAFLFITMYQSLSTTIKDNNKYHSFAQSCFILREGKLLFVSNKSFYNL